MEETSSPVFNDSELGQQQHPDDEEENSSAHAEELEDNDEEEEMEEEEEVDEGEPDQEESRFSSSAIADFVAAEEQPIANSAIEEEEFAVDEEAITESDEADFSNFVAEFENQPPMVQEQPPTVLPAAVFIKCHQCPEKTFDNSVDLELHVLVDHVRYLPYECSECPHVRLPTEKTIREHYKSIHPHIREPQISYVWRKELEIEVKEHMADSLSLNAERVCHPEVQLVHPRPRTAAAVHQPTFAPQRKPPKRQTTRVKVAKAPTVVTPQQVAQQPDAVHDDDEQTEEATTDCALCSVSVTDQSEHCYNVHFEKAIFVCPLKAGDCRKLRHTTRAEMVKHITAVHGQDVPPVRTGKFTKEHNKLLRACFPPPVVVTARSSRKRRATTAGTVATVSADAAATPNNAPETPVRKQPKLDDSLPTVALPKAAQKRVHRCEQCLQSFDVKCIRWHIVSVHLQKYTKVCSLCSDVGSYRDVATVNRHIRNEHKDDASAFVIDMNHEYADEIAHFYKTCFPNVRPNLQTRKRNSNGRRRKTIN